MYREKQLNYILQYGFHRQSGNFNNHNKIVDEEITIVVVPWIAGIVQSI